MGGGASKSRAAKKKSRAGEVTALTVGELGSDPLPSVAELVAKSRGNSDSAANAHHGGLPVGIKPLWEGDPALSAAVPACDSPPDDDFKLLSAARDTRNSPQPSEINSKFSAPASTPDMASSAVPAASAGQSRSAGPWRLAA